MLNDFIQIRQRLEEVTFSGNEILGFLTPSDDEILALIRLSDASCIERFVTYESKNKSISEINSNDKIQVRLYPKQLSNEFYYETVEDLIKSMSQSYPANRFYVHSLNYDSTSSELPEDIRNYFDITKLIGFLKGISNYQKENELVFFQTNSLIIDTRYSLNDISALEGLDALISHIQDSVDKKEREIIFINEMISSLSKIPIVSSRFKFLIDHFNDFALNYQKSHTLYLEQYSYQKFKSEIDKEIIEQNKRIQGVINDAKSKLVAIPIAFLLIMGQFDLTGEKMYFNLSLVLGSFVFSFLLEIFLKNQYSALDFIKDDVGRFKKSVEEEKVEILRDDFTAAFSKITKSYEKQKCYLDIIRTIVWLTFIIAIALFIVALFNNTTTCFLLKLFN